jgi:spermidine synthase
MIDPADKGGNFCRRGISVGLALISLSTLMMELVLTRVFDVILTPNMAYMVITSALFSFGLSGIYVTLRPLTVDTNVPAFVARAAILFSISTLLILPALNLLPFDYFQIGDAPLLQLASFGGMYLALVIPFFLSGVIFASLFSTYSGQIGSLYAWDLTGAAVGCVILVPFLPLIGPGGLLFCASGLALFSSSLFIGRRPWSFLGMVLAGIIMVIPFVSDPAYFEFREHLSKRGVKEARELGKVEFTRWDPISKIDVIAQEVRLANGASFDLKHIAYDGGSQSSYFLAFDGDYDQLAHDIDNGEPEIILKRFSDERVLAAHYLKRHTSPNVLVIGSAGGREIKAALFYGAKHVDAIEMVSTVVRLATTSYAQYTGYVYTHPRVTARIGEGRSFLRGSRDRYDIIQIYSNHTSSSIAAGTGAMDTTYLQTAEAYQEYFEHLSDDGILQINHHVFPRMVTTAALAWRQMNRKDFQRHVAVFERVEGADTLPTLLFKMKPWRAAELNEIQAILPPSRYRLVENPVQPEQSFLSPSFYSGQFPPRIARTMGYRIVPSTDDRPYFNFIRREINYASPDAKRFMNSSIATMLNSQLKKHMVPMDIIHLIVTTIVSLFFMVTFVVLPLRYSIVGRSDWRGKYSVVLYFACLGAGFIIFELIFIQIFMKLIGYPLYTYSAVVFTLLLSAGVGSACSGILDVAPWRRWWLPFIGVLMTGFVLWIAYPYVFTVFLGSSVGVRIGVSVGMIFPLGFFLGMPFPLGILAIENQPKGAIGWAWGMNGIFTVIGGLASVLLSIFLGFKISLLVGLAMYALAFVSFSGLKQDGMPNLSRKPNGRTLAAEGKTAH